MKKKNISSFLLISGAAFLAGSAAAQSAGNWDPNFKKRVYIGAGGGVTDLTPNTDGSRFMLQDDSDAGGLVFVGLDVFRRLSFELQYADLGNAELVDTVAASSEISYESASLSGLLYLWNIFADDEFQDFDGLDLREGLSLYGRLGVGAIENDGTNNIPFTEGSDAQVVAGLGLEYGLQMGLAARVEYIRYATDAEFAGLSLLYRFGRGPGLGLEELAEPELPVLPAPIPITELPPPPVPVELPSLPEVAEIPPLPIIPEPSLDSTDSDADGVANSVDDCPDTISGTPVNSSGCEMFNGVIEGVNFLSGSDVLTEVARSTLDEVVATLDAFPDIKLAIESHTDNRGGEQANLDLSRSRALSVVRYLISRGIQIERLQARAFGEARPIADNTTEDGQLLNRRVEFRIQP